MGWAPPAFTTLLAQGLALGKLADSLAMEGAVGMAPAPAQGALGQCQPSLHCPLLPSEATGMEGPPYPTRHCPMEGCVDMHLVSLLT